MSLINQFDKKYSIKGLLGLEKEEDDLSKAKREKKKAA
jgi:hypothetical protein